MKKIYFILLSFSLFQLACQSSNEKNPYEDETKNLQDSMKLYPQPNPYANSKIEFKIFNNDTTPDSSLHGYGYNIFIDGKLYVHQPHIPAVSGNNGFTNVTNAEKAASLITYKIKNNVMPPSVTSHELDSIGALK